MTGYWLKMVTDDGVLDITEMIPGFMFSGAKPEYPITHNENTSFNGVDGELPSATTFAPFNLVVNCGYDGNDEQDKHLFERRLRSLFFRRKPYYIVTSNDPGIKYPVQSPNIQEDILDFAATSYEMAFPVYTGYAESLKETDKFSLSSGEWQLEAGVLNNEEIKYIHESTTFQIYNGSTNVINPNYRGKLNIYINIDAPYGFKLLNKTTGDVFEYKQSLKNKTTLWLNGLYPIVDGKHVGINTNNSWISLKQGFNDIEIIGKSIGKVKTKWVFPFVYR